MEKTISASYGGINSKVGEMLVNRLIPNRYIQAVGPFVFLDHLYPSELSENAKEKPSGEFAHPHRGIATFSYLFSGSMSHYDSRGHTGTITAGGLQWMKAGNGIIHDENPGTFPQEGNKLHALQFWINLPAKYKAEDPEYISLQRCDLPRISLPDNAGTLSLLIGEMGDKRSPVKMFSRQFIYHIRLQPKSSFTLPTSEDMEYGAFVPAGQVKINGSLFGNSELVIFESDHHEIALKNENILPADIIVFGGEPYTEPIVAQGPFVMNSHAEIAEAYRDFFSGKYGKIEYAQ